MHARQSHLADVLYFLISLAYVFKKSDPGGSPDLLGLLIDALFYTDDAALLTQTAEEASIIMATISKALRD